MNSRIPKLRSAFFCTAVTALAANTAFATDISILPLGDSITAGFSNQLSFREELDARLDDAGCNFISRGTVFNDGYQGAGPHEGRPGFRVDNFINGRGQLPDIDTLLDDDFARNGGYPDAILLNLGTNDVVFAIERQPNQTQNQTVNTTLNLSLIHI